MLLNQEEFQGVLSTGHHIAITMIFTKDLAGYVLPHLLRILKDLSSPWQQTFNFLLHLRTACFCLPSPISSQVILGFIYFLLAYLSPILSLSSWHQASCIPVSLTKATTSHLHMSLLSFSCPNSCFLGEISLGSRKCWYHHLQLFGHFQMCCSPHLPASTVQLLMCASSCCMVLFTSGSQISCSEAIPHSASYGLHIYVCSYNHILDSLVQILGKQSRVNPVIRF